MTLPKFARYLWPLVAFLVAGVLESFSRQLQLTPGQSSFLAGEKVVIVLPQPLLKGAEEFELLLQAPGLKAELVRLTPSYLVHNRTVTFKVPNLPGTVARLVLRGGAGGREWLVATSEEFFIVASHGRDIPRLVQRQGEWWFEASSGLQQTECLSGWDGNFPGFLPLWVGPKSPKYFPFSPASQANRQRASHLSVAAQLQPGVWQTQMSFPQRE